MEEEGSEEKTHNHTSSPYHRDNRNHRPWQAQGVIIQEIGRAQKHGDKQNGPFPAETRFMISPMPPQQCEGCAHEEHLIKIVL